MVQVLVIYYSGTRQDYNTRALSIYDMHCLLLREKMLNSNKSKMYEEESRTLPAQFVQQIMQDDSCVAVPLMNSITGTGKLYYIAIRDMQTQQEYMHPTPLSSLDNYQIHFLNCPLLRAYDMSTEIKSFPSLKSPGSSSHIAYHMFYPFFFGKEV